MIKKSKMRFYSIFLSALMLVVSTTACTKQTSESTAVSESEVITGDNKLKNSNSKVLNNIELLSTKKELADVESEYEYEKEIQFWTPEQKFEITTKKDLNMLKGDNNIPAVQFFLDENLSIEISTKYEQEIISDSDKKYTISPNTYGLGAVENLYYYKDAEDGDSKQEIREAIRLRGGVIGWSSGDVIYMLQNVNFETGEKLSKPKVTTIVMDREEREVLTPEYYVNENGEFYAQWDPVEGAEAYAIISYYKMPDMDHLNKMIEENNKKAKQHEKEASVDDPLVMSEYLIDKGNESGGNSEIFYMEDSMVSVVDIVTDTKYSINDSEYYDESIQKKAQEGMVTSLPRYIQTSQLPDSLRYLSVVALKKGTGVDEAEAAARYDGDPQMTELLKELDEDSKEPGYYAIEESPLYDFNALAQKIPEYVKKFESKYPSTSKLTVEKAEDITSFMYIRMTDGSIRKHNLEYMNEYLVEQKDVDDDENKEDIQDVLSVKVKVKNTPFYFKFNIKEFNKDDPEKDVEIIKKTFDEAVKFKADMEEYPSKAPIIKIDKVNKSISFISDGEKRFYNSSLSKGKTEDNKSKISTYLKISSSKTDGGLSAYSDSERKECLQDDVVASTKMSEEIAWALMTGQKQFVIDYDTDRNEIENAIREVCWQNQLILELDYPESNITRQNDGSYLVEMDYFISDIDQRKEMQREMKAKAESILNSLQGKYSSSLELLYEINNYICETVEYDHSVIENNINKTTSRTAYGPLLEGKGVCSAYSRIFQLLMTMSDLTCFVDGGSVASGGKHAWNIVRTKDGYYMVDSTWNDSDDGNIYLMVPEEVYSVDHWSERICIAESETIKNVDYAYSGGEYDYLSYIGKAVTIDDLDEALVIYGSYGYCPDWLRVYDFNYDTVPYLTSAANSLYDKYGISVYYTATWKPDWVGIIAFSAEGLETTDKIYGKKIE